MASSPQKTLESVQTYVREAALLEATIALLEWDERTKMPDAAGGFRADQITHLAGLLHQRRTAKQLGDQLEELAASPLATDVHSDAGTTIRQLRRDYKKRTRLPQDLVEELARQAIVGQQAWVKARAANDFASFAPHLKRMFELKREQAEALGYQQNRYDALLDDYEPDAKSDDIARVLAGLRAELSPLVERLLAGPRRPDTSILTRRFPRDVQEQFGSTVAARIGFDFQRGRLDTTHHPFCTGLGPNDCRITTRYDEHFFPMALFGILHEAGHGIYDQGLRTSSYGLPPGTYVSLGIHESQSRMWENFVGRSHAFWRHFYPAAQAAFPEALADVSLDDFHFAINDVRPSLIRVEADEATYNLHIIIRFELERALLADQLQVDDLPSAWRQKYREYLGIEPPDDADGVLQDVHWSAGLIGYFPTYSLGNLYAAQFYETADRELGGLAEQFARGEFMPLREWLQRNIHARGQCYSASELVVQITGSPLSAEPLLRHLRGKLEPLFA